MSEPEIEEVSAKMRHPDNFEYLSVVFAIKDRKKLQEKLKPFTDSLHNKEIEEEIGGKCVCIALDNLDDYKDYRNYVENKVDCSVIDLLSFDDWKESGRPEGDDDF